MAHCLPYRMAGIALMYCPSSVGGKMAQQQQVKPAAHNLAGATTAPRFDIETECKPRRAVPLGRTSFTHFNSFLSNTLLSFAPYPRVLAVIMTLALVGGVGFGFLL